MSNELLAIADAVLALAKKNGAAHAAASVTRSRNVETTWRDGKLENVADAVSRSLSMQLFVDGKYGSVWTSDLREAALEKFVRDSVAMVRAIAPDPHRKLPDPALYAGRSEADLETYDPRIADLAADARLARARAIEEGARAARGGERIVSVTASVNDGSSETARAASNGFQGTTRGTYVSTSASVSMKEDDGKRPQDWADASVRNLSDLPEAAALGREATERTLARLGAKKIESGTMNVLVEARASRNLLRHLMGPMSGGALQQKESFYEGKLGKAVASSAFTLRDEPLMKRGLASRPFDGEGITSKPRPLIDKGVLRTFCLDVYYASKLGMAANGGSTSNVIVEPGKRSLDELAAAMKDGILVTSFLGGNSNSTTGIFSLGIAGFRVGGGKRQEPIAEMNISGSHLEFWKRLAHVGNDTYVFSSTRSPSLLFEKVSVAGK